MILLIFPEKNRFSVIQVSIENGSGAKGAIRVILCTHPDVLSGSLRLLDKCRYFCSVIKYLLVSIHVLGFHSYCCVSSEHVVVVQSPRKFNFTRGKS
mgnify:CR=1 FL=1